MIETITETTELPVERVTKLRPSEAMRLGRMLRPRRITGQLYQGTDGACPVGAILIGGGQATDLHRLTSCPLGALNTIGRCHLKHAKSTVRFFVTHLNDSHGWRDAQIASWLAGLGL